MLFLRISFLKLSFVYYYLFNLFHDLPLKLLIDSSLKYYNISIYNLNIAQIVLFYCCFYLFFLLVITHCYLFILIKSYKI